MCVSVRVCVCVCVQCFYMGYMFILVIPRLYDCGEANVEVKNIFISLINVFVCVFLCACVGVCPTLSIRVHKCMCAYVCVCARVFVSLDVTNYTQECVGAGLCCH